MKPDNGSLQTTGPSEVWAEVAEHRALHLCPGGLGWHVPPVLHHGRHPDAEDDVPCLPGDQGHLTPGVVAALLQAWTLLPPPAEPRHRPPLRLGPLRSQRGGDDREVARSLEEQVGADHLEECRHSGQDDGGEELRVVTGGLADTARGGGGARQCSGMVGRYFGDRSHLQVWCYHDVMSELNRRMEEDHPESVEDQELLQ